MVLQPFLQYLFLTRAPFALNFDLFRARTRARWFFQISKNLGFHGGFSMVIGLKMRFQHVILASCFFNVHALRCALLPKPRTQHTTRSLIQEVDYIESVAESLVDMNRTSVVICTVFVLLLIFCLGGIGSSMLGAESNKSAQSTYVHNIAVTNVSLSTYQFFSMPPVLVNINVSVRNEGDFTEHFNVTVEVNQTLSQTVLDTYYVTSLGEHEEIDIPFVWNTSSFLPGNYIVTALATVVQGENDTSDNTGTSNIVEILLDSTAPVIGVPQQPDQGSGYVIVNVFDNESGVKDVVLSYKVNNVLGVDNETWWNISMTYSYYYPGFHEAYIPVWLYETGAIESYKIIAYDNAGNEAFRDNGGLNYSYVVPEYSLPFILMLPMVASAIALAVWRHRRTSLRARINQGKEPNSFMEKCLESN
jgi:hypothetical protein